MNYLMLNIFPDLWPSREGGEIFRRTLGKLTSTATGSTCCIAKCSVPAISRSPESSPGRFFKAYGASNGSTVLTAVNYTLEKQDFRCQLRLVYRRAVIPANILLLR